MDKKEFLENLVRTIQSSVVESAIESQEITYDFPSVTAHKEHVHAVLKFLKENPEYNFHFLTDLTGFQTPDEKSLGVIYHLHNMPKNTRLRVKNLFPISNPEIPTATDIWP